MRCKCLLAISILYTRAFVIPQQSFYFLPANVYRNAETEDGKRGEMVLTLLLGPNLAIVDLAVNFYVYGVF